LEYSKIYLWNETKKELLFDNKVNMNDTLILLIEGVKGFKVENNFVFPKYSFEIQDNDENIVMSFPNILHEYIETGIDVDKFTNNQLPLFIFFVDRESQMSLEKYFLER
jgi:hypothetical protein